MSGANETCLSSRSHANSERATVDKSFCRVNIAAYHASANKFLVEHELSGDGWGTKFVSAMGDRAHLSQVIWPKRKSRTPARPGGDI